MRRKSLHWLAAFLTFLSGCQKPFIQTEVDYSYYNRMSGDFEPAQYGESADTSVPPISPRTVRDPEAKVKWELSLEEAKRLALAGNKQIAFLGYQPAQQGTRIDAELSAFDSFFEIGGGWGRTDRQVANRVQVFGTDLATFQQNIFGGQAGFGTNATAGASTQEQLGSIPGNSVFGWSKRNAAGGFTTLSYSLDYSRVNPVSIFNAVNPAWTSELRLGIEQPLLQGAGVEFNRSRILIARAQHEQSIRTFVQNVQTLLRDVELAYWQLYFTYQDHYSRDRAMTQALFTWQKEKNKEIVGQAAPPAVAQARQQYELFGAAKIEAQARVHTAERNLRELLGLPPEDGRQIIPQEPTVAEYEPNWEVALIEAMENRPDLAAQRFVIRAAELELYRQKNGLLPDLTFNASYILSGLDNQFDKSIDRMTDNQFSDWFMGIRLRRQIGERAAHAQVQRARLALSEQRRVLQNLEHTVVHDLHEAYQEIITSYELIQKQRDRRQASAVRLQATEQFFRQGRETIDLVLQSQAEFADALRDEAAAIVRYNQAIARWEFARGTILQSDNVVVAEEQFSWTSNRFGELRRRQLEWSLPLPLHKGSKLHVDHDGYEADEVGPLYPMQLQEIESPVTESPAAGATPPPKKDAPGLLAPEVGEAPSAAPKPARKPEPPVTLPPMKAPNPN